MADEEQRHEHHYRALKTLFILVSAYFFQYATFAASYYISESGNDADSGLTISNSWKTFSNTLTIAFNSGDSILLKRGDNFDSPLTVTNSGVTISAYGAGANPIVNGDHPTAVWGAVIDHEGYFTNQPLVGSVNIQSVYDSTGKKYHSMGNRQSTNLDVWLGNFTNSCWGVDNATKVYYLKTTDGNIPQNMHLFDFKSVHISGGNSMVENLEIKNGGIGIYVQGTSNRISDNLIHDCAGSGVYAYNSSGNNIYSNTIHNLGYTMIYLIGPGGGHWVHHNLCHTNGQIICGNVDLGSGLDTSGIGFLSGTNNLVEHNQFSYINQSFFDYYFEANTEVRYNYGFRATDAASPGGTGLSLHHNIFDMDNIGAGIVPSHYWGEESQIESDTGSVLVYNNTVENFRGNALYVVGDTNENNVVVRNNIFQTSSDYNGGSLGVTETGINSDYNIFYSTGIAPRWSYNGTLYYSLATLHSASGQEQHSIYTNANFSVSNPINDIDFRLAANSPAIDSGQNLKSASLISSGTEYLDYSGGPVPKGTGADIGAFEYGNIFNIGTLRAQNLILR